VAKFGVWWLNLELEGKFGVRMLNLELGCYVWS
jgi:hypothetical protein